MSSKRVKPLPLEIIYLDEIASKLEDLNQKFEDQNKLIGPTAWLFPRDQQYQYKTVAANSSDVVYELYVPRHNMVGVITEVANSWYENTYLEWEIDRLPKRVEYVIGSVDAPKEFTNKGIPFYERVRWTAYNNDAVEHTFEVLCDGYFIEKKLFKRLVGIQGEPLR